MRSQLQRRLAELHAERESGERMLADLDARRAALRETLLRISGAVQVLEEELERAEAADEGESAPAANGAAPLAAAAS